MFSYIVTGVILVYNDIITIIVCMFAVYGAYAFLKEIIMFCLKKFKVTVAVRVSDKSDLFNTLAAADFYISTYAFLEKKPVLLCESNDAELLKKYGYDVYIKQTEEKWQEKET